MSKKQEFKLLEAAIKYAEQNNGGIELVKAFVAGAAAFGIEGEEIPMELKTFDPEAVVSDIEIDGVKYVRLHAGKYDFRIDIHDAPNLMNWDDAKKYAEDKGMRLFSVEEGLLMYCFKDEINAKAVELGGEALREDEDYWSGTESLRSGARYVGFGLGFATYTSKCYGALFGLSQSIHRLRLGATILPYGRGSQKTRPLDSLQEYLFVIILLEGARRSCVPLFFT